MIKSYKIVQAEELQKALQLPAQKISAFQYNPSYTNLKFLAPVSKADYCISHSFVSGHYYEGYVFLSARIPSYLYSVCKWHNF